MFIFYLMAETQITRTTPPQIKKAVGALLDNGRALQAASNTRP